MASKKVRPAPTKTREPRDPLAALLAHAPDRATWTALTATLDGLSGAKLTAALKKAEPVIAGWPLGLRSMPDGWWASLLAGKADPRAALARRRTLRGVREGDDDHLGTYALQVESSPDRMSFVTADASLRRREGGDVALWDAATGALRHVLVSGRDDLGEAHALGYSADGRWVAAALVDDADRARIRLWNASTGALVWAQELTPEPPPRGDEDVVARDDDRPRERVALGFTPDGKHLWSASRRLGRLRCWDVATGASRGELPDEPGVTAIALSAKGRLLATGTSGGWLRVWDLADESLLAEVRAGNKAIASVGFSGDGKKLASVGPALDLWAIDGESLVKKASHPNRARGEALPGAFSIAARPRGVIRVATVVHGGVSVRDLPGKKALRIKLGSSVESLRLSADGALLTAASTRRARLFWLRG